MKKLYISPIAEWTVVEEESMIAISGDSQSSTHEVIGPDGKPIIPSGGQGSGDAFSKQGSPIWED